MSITNFKEPKSGKNWGGEIYRVKNKLPRVANGTLAIAYMGRPCAMQTINLHFHSVALYFTVCFPSLSLNVESVNGSTNVGIDYV